MNQSRIYDTELDYFEHIDVPEKAYILGFIAADGCNSGEKMIINMNKNDVEILDFIRSQISADKKFYINDQNNQVTLSIHSVQICRDLTIHKVVKAKTKILEFPDLEDHLISHYLRGFFDGDGCISFNTHGRETVHPRLGFMCASKSFIEKVEEILRSSCDLKFKKLYKNSKSDAWSLEYEGNNQVKKIFDYLYKDSCFHLSRKYNKFINHYGQLSK